MSFVKKALKKVWSFIKEHWVEIVLVAAVVFTAGVATIGFSAFAGVSSVGGFFSAVGSTMWAGVAGVAGSMGIGQGAVVGAGGMTTAGGVSVAAGTHVGLGAAWGAGAGAGWGAGAGSKIAAANAADSIAATGTAGGIGGATVNPINSVAGTSTGMPGSASGAGFSTTTPAGATAAVNPATTAAGAAKSIPAAVKSGLTLESAVKFGTAVAPYVGAWMMAKGEEDQLNQYNVDAAFGGNQFTGKNASGGPGPGKNFLEPPPPEGASGGQAGNDPNQAATGLMQNQLGNTVRPFQSIYGYKQRIPTGAESDQYGGPMQKPLMAGG
jgi:hypothetical protein